MPGGKIRIVDINTTETVRQWECHAEESFPRTFLDDGRILVSDHDDNTTRFWDVAGGREIFRLDGLRIRACCRDREYAASVVESVRPKFRAGTQTLRKPGFHRFGPPGRYLSHLLRLATMTVMFRRNMPADTLGRY